MGDMSNMWWVIKTLVCGEERDKRVLKNTIKNYYNLIEERKGRK